MEIIRDALEFKKWRTARNHKKLGFVPTMGALHIGHEELLKRARRENELVVLSIYVNPTQFNDKKDFSAYPITWDEDVEIAKQNGVDAIFAPTYPTIYPDDFTYVISENKLAKTLCGATRPGHFDGVLTVVMKLLNIVSPNKAYFGEKDYQQLNLIRGMVDAFFLDCKIVPIPIVREEDGLAYSSRNSRLSERGRQIAPNIYKIISTIKELPNARLELEKLGYVIDYLEDIDGRRFVAVKTNDTINNNEVRLIDNVAL